MKHYDDLIQRLCTATKLPMLQSLCNEAADAIEELSRNCRRSQATTKKKAKGGGLPPAKRKKKSRSCARNWRRKT